MPAIVAIALHEFGHALMSWLCGVKVKRIGLCWLDPHGTKESGTASQNFLIAGSGIATNLVCALIFFGTDFALYNTALAVICMLPLPRSDCNHLLFWWKRMK
jgi:Zn-dependent protease